MKCISLSLVGGVLIIAALFICGGILEELQMGRAGEALIRMALTPMLAVESFLPPEHSDNPNPAAYDHEIRIVGMLIALCLNVFVHSLPVYMSLLRLAKRKRIA